MFLFSFFCSWISLPSVDMPHSVAFRKIILAALTPGDSQQSIHPINKTIFFKIQSKIVPGNLFICVFYNEQYFIKVEPSNCWI